LSFIACASVLSIPFHYLCSNKNFLIITSGFQIFCVILFCFSLFCLLHSYVFFPLILDILSNRKKRNDLIFRDDDAGLPSISILLAVYNEEKVIEQKIASTFKTGYPKEKIEFLIGSDASTDDTNRIINDYAEQWPQIKLVHFEGRTGKSGIINALADMAQNEIFILTDANVFFREDTLYQLVKHYKNPEIALVGGNILNRRFKKDGISVQEKTYLSRENRIKYQEGLLWGAMIGAFGGCYSVRGSFYAPVPPKFFMDDFYITMNVIEHGGKAINELDALCYEDVSNKSSEEFRRKVRISIGNFQNFGRYAHLLWPPFSGRAIAFWSHKVLRWLGPFFILLMLLSCLVLSLQTLFFLILLAGQVLLMLTPLLDIMLKKLNIHVLLLRFISHFYLMNLALFVGFIKYIKGVESNIWKPTQRYQ
jgi:cellulose synthase/poly-beta-1,6-N-acetylglucosamine synthase-like glycosyltransferase